MDHQGVNNYFRSGTGRKATYVFFDDRDETSVRKAWLAVPKGDRVGVWQQVTSCKGPWHDVAVVIFDRFELDNGLGRLGNGESAFPVQPVGTPGTRSKIGPVLS